MTKQLEKQEDYTFKSFSTVKSSTIENAPNNPYPNVYLSYECSSGIIRDKHTDFVKAAGCTNLERGTNGVFNDVEHEGYFASSQEVKKLTNSAGDVIEMWVQDDILYGKSRIGVEHNIYDRTGQKIGSSYASAWLTHAQSEVNQNGGNVYDYIPANIKKEFFDGQQVRPYKAISIEAEYGHYLDENNHNLKNQLNINKFDVTAITFLYKNPPAQIYSNIVGSFIKTKDSHEKTINNMLNNKINLTLLKCLCDMKMLVKGTYLIDKAETKLYYVSDSTETEVQVVNVQTEEVVSTTLDDLKGDENLDVASTEEVTDFVKSMPTLKSFKASKLPKSVIKMCQLCAGKKSTDWRKTIDTPTVTTKMDNTQDPNAIDNIDTTQVQNQANDNEIGLLRTTIIEMGKSLDAVLSQVDMIVQSLAQDTNAQAPATTTKSIDGEVETLAAIEARLTAVEASYNKVDELLTDAIITTDEEAKDVPDVTAEVPPSTTEESTETPAPETTDNVDITAEPVIKFATIKSFKIETKEDTGFSLPDVK
jgi:hypothetical protein